MRNRVRVCYALTQYPGVSNTFIRNEVEAVKAAGVDIVPMPVRRTAEDQVLSEADRAAHADARPLLPLTAHDLLRCVIVPLLRHPRAWLGVLRLALRTGGTDVRELIWRCFWFLEAMKMWRTCRDEDITHLHSHFASVSSNLAWFATEFANRSGDTGGRKWTWSFTMHGYHEFIEQKAHRIDLKVESAESIICIADYIKAQVMRLSAPEHWHKMSVVGCGIDVGKFAYQPPTWDAEEARPFRVLHVGRLAEEKGQTLLVEAVGTLRDRGHDVQLDIIGAGPLRPAVEQRRADLGLEAAVQLHGARGHDEILDWYHRADAFALASFVEGIPVVLMEAMASGTPVVAPWITGIPELVESDVSGLLVRPARSDALADALERLITERDLSNRLSEAGRRAVEKNFNLAHTGPAVAHIIENAAAQA